jgi:hypothetical protein
VDGMGPAPLVGLPPMTLLLRGGGRGRGVEGARGGGHVGTPAVFGGSGADATGGGFFSFVAWHVLVGNGCPFRHKITPNSA